MLAEGLTPTAALARLNAAIGLRTTVLPMSDDPVRTWVRTGEAGWCNFQEFMIRERAAGLIEALEYRGAEQARPSEQVLAAIESARAVVIGPSNPLASIGPILAVPGIREALLASRAPVVAVSPIVDGAGAEGPDGGVHVVCRTGAAERTGSPTSTASCSTGSSPTRTSRACRALQTDTRMDDAPRARACRRAGARRSPKRFASLTMRTAAVLPVKRFACAKQRLGASVADPLRVELAGAMVADVLSALDADAGDRAHDRRHRRGLPWPAAAAAGGAIVVADPDERGQSAAVELGIESGASTRASSACCCVPGDCPALDPAELDGCCPSAATPRRAAVTRRRDRARPPRQRHQRAAAHAARRDRARLRPRQLRAPPCLPALAAGATAEWSVRPRCCSTSTPARTSPRCATACAGAARARRARERCSTTPSTPGACRLPRPAEGDGRRGRAARTRARGLPEMRRGDDLAALIVDALARRAAARRTAWS